MKTAQRVRSVERSLLFGLEAGTSGKAIHNGAAKAEIVAEGVPCHYRKEPWCASAFHLTMNGVEPMPNKRFKLNVTVNTPDRELDYIPANTDSLDTVVGYIIERHPDCTSMVIRLVVNKMEDLA